MKKLVFVLIAALMLACMPMVAMAADPDRVYPEGGNGTPFDGESRDNEVNVNFAYDDDGNIIIIEDWYLMDGYAVDISWSNLSFLYILEGEDGSVSTRYVSKWDPDQLKWILWDTVEKKEVTGGLNGQYDENGLFDFAGIDTVTVTSTADAVTDKDLGINGFAVTNRSSKGISVEYNYTQTKPLYTNPSQALETNSANIPAVYGQVGGNGSEATLYTSYNFLNVPTIPPLAPGVCGFITITIK